MERMFFLSFPDPRNLKYPGCLPKIGRDRRGGKCAEGEKKLCREPKRREREDNIHDDGRRRSRMQFPGIVQQKKGGKYTIEKCRKRGLRGGRKDKVPFFSQLACLMGSIPLPPIFSSFFAVRKNGKTRTHATWKGRGDRKESGISDMPILPKEAGWRERTL